MRHTNYALQSKDPVFTVQLFNTGYNCHIRSIKLSVYVVKNKAILMSLRVSKLYELLINWVTVFKFEPEIMTVSEERSQSALRQREDRSVQGNCK